LLLALQQEHMPLTPGGLGPPTGWPRAPCESFWTSGMAAAHHLIHVCEQQWFMLQGLLWLVDGFS
jgi:hypothetical protein